MFFIRFLFSCSFPSAALTIRWGMRIAAVWLLMLMLAPCAIAAPKPTAHKLKKNADLADTLFANVIYTKFAKLVEASGLGTFLSSRGPFTLFVPTNSAFSKLPPGMYEDLLRPENNAQLQRLVLFHVINGKAWHAMDLKVQKSLVSCEGSPLPLKTTKAGTLFVDKAKVLRADQHCANGMIDEVDALMMPPQLVIVAGTPADAAAAAAPAATNAAPVDMSGDTNDAPLKNLPPAPAPPTGPIQ